MLIEYRNGRRKEVKDAPARYLIKIGRAQAVIQDGYATRDMANLPQINRPVVPPVLGDGLDGLDKAQLHSLAKERGLQLHHMLGADKVRAALRGESAE